jgi:hypothetical protein
MQCGVRDLARLNCSGASRSSRSNGWKVFAANLSRRGLGAIFIADRDFSASDTEEAADPPAPML